MSATPSIAQHKTTLNILWVAMLAAMGIYWVIKVLVVARAAASPQHAGLLVLPLIGLSTLLYGLAWWWFHAQLGAISQRLTPTAAGQLSAADRDALASKLQAVVIVCMALLEAPVIFGLVSAFVRNPQPLFECALTASLLGMGWLRLTGYPKVFSLLDRLEPAPSTR
jgi:F0F1-type ATP synthase membrane subunit c/vacuolar-type H+-ATPase subunit K